MPVWDWCGWLKGRSRRYSGNPPAQRICLASQYCAPMCKSLKFTDVFALLVFPSHSPPGVFKVRPNGICDSASSCVPAGVCEQKSRPGWDLKGRGSAARIMAGFVGFAAFYHNIHISQISQQLHLKAAFDSEFIYRLNCGSICSLEILIRNANV